MNHTNSTLKVQNACDVIWNCQVPEDVAFAVKVLHQALLRDKVDSYDPAEAFLSVQGAALRFHPSQIKKPRNQKELKKQQNDDNDGDTNNCSPKKTADADDEMMQRSPEEAPDKEQQQRLKSITQIKWSIMEESLWAVAALACVCVGPAWMYQLSQRRLWLLSKGKLPRYNNQGDDQSVSMSTQSSGGHSELLPHDIYVGSIRSFSPVTATSSVDQYFMSYGRNDTASSSIRYPHIAEVLPAAMLRFAASALSLFPSDVSALSNQDQMQWKGRQKSTAVAQRYLVLALCCDSPNTISPAIPSLPTSAGAGAGAGATSSGSTGNAMGVTTTTLNNNIPRERNNDTQPLDNHKQHVTPKLTDWAISGGRELVGNMLAFWLRVANITKLKDDDVVLTGAAPLSPQIIKSSNDAQFELDWTYILDVARAATDLVSAGWRPVTKTEVAGQIVECLLAIADKALGVLEECFLSDAITAPSSVAVVMEAITREGKIDELRKASSSAAEAISALASLGSRGLIPATSQHATTCVLCHLHVKSGAIKASLLESLQPTVITSDDDSDNKKQNDESWETERRDFTTQVESCFADTADFLWVLFANQASAANAIAALLETVNAANLHSSSCVLTSTSVSLTSSPPKTDLKSLEDWDRRKKLVCMEAGTAVRMMSAAFWGRQPDVTGLSHLRIYWDSVLNVICEIATTTHDVVRPVLESHTTADEASFGFPVRDMLSLALDTVVALGNFVDREVGGGATETYGVVSPAEWETFLCGLEAAVLPWLEYPSFDADFQRQVLPLVESSSSASTEEENTKKAIPGILERAHFEIESLLVRLGWLLDKCFRIEKSPFHSVIPYESQKKLYLFILQKAIPHMLEAKDAEFLGLCVIRAWSKFGLFPFRCDGWTQTAADILNEAFVIFEDGSYLHSPQVRLEALRLLTYGEISEVPTLLAVNSSLEERSNPSGGGSSGSNNNISSSHISLFTMTEKIMGVHLELVKKSLIPVLKSIFRVDEDSKTQQSRHVIPLCNASKARCRRVSVGNDYKNHDGDARSTGSTSDSSFILEMYAVKLLGRLVRQPTLGRANRALFVNMLQSVVLDGRLGTSCDSCGTSVGGAFLKDEISTNKSSNLRFKDSARLEAVRELELCLAAPFSMVPNIHDVVSPILKFLCQRISNFSESSSDAHVAFPGISSYERAILALQSLVALSRMRLAEGNRLSLVGRREIVRHLPADLLPWIARSTREGIGTPASPRHVAPFIRVHGCHSGSSFGGTDEGGSDRSIVYFDSIFSSIASAIEGICNKSGQTDPEVDHVLQTLTCLCYRTVTSFLRSGFQLPDPAAFEEACRVSIAPTDVEPVKLARCNAVVTLGQRLVADYSNMKVQDKYLKHEIPSIKSSVVFNLWLDSCDSLDYSESQVACRALIVTLPKLKLLWADGEEILVTIFSRFQNSLQNLLETREVSSVEKGIAAFTSRLIVLHAIVQDMLCVLTSEKFLLFFDTCKSLIAHLITQPPSFCLYLAIRCTIATIDRLPYRTAESIADNWNGIETEAIRDNKTHTEVPSDVPGSEFIRLIVSELLEQRMRALQAGSGAGKESTGPSIPAELTTSKHEEFAIEVEHLDSFEVEDARKYHGSPTAAWLCGDSVLLTCRIGSSISRYRGWVEIVVRCPTSRKRSMVRLLSVFALKRPEPPTIFLADSIAAPCSGLISNVSNSPLQAVDEAASDILVKAQMALARFELALPSAEKEEKDSTIDACQSALDIDKQVIPTSINVGMSHPRNISSMTSPSGDPAGSRVESPLGSEIKSTKTADPSIHGWLVSVFGEASDKQKDIEQALRQLNFPLDTIHQSSERLDIDNCQGTVLMNRLPVRRLEQGPRLERAISVLDRTVPSNTHKVGLLYAGPRRIGNAEMDVETLLLTATNCSPPFHQFAEGLGKMVLTKHLRYFSAGLDVSNYQSDGQYTRAWIGQDFTDGSSLTAAMSIVVFHVVSFMPEGLNSRKRHIGNDNVHIVFVDRDSPTAVDLDLTDGEVENRPVVSGHFGFVTIYVVTLPQPELLKVIVQVRQGLPDPLRHELLNFVGRDVVAFQDAPSYVRGIAILADLACRSAMDNLSPASNCHERYRMLREMVRHAVQ